MGRQRKQLKLHKVKGYYSTYRVGGRTRYKYFGTLDREDAFKRFSEWRQLGFPKPIDPKARLASIGGKKHQAWRKLAELVQSQPAFYSGGDKKYEALLKMHRRRIDEWIEYHEVARSDVELSRRRRRVSLTAT